VTFIEGYQCIEIGPERTTLAVHFHADVIGIGRIEPNPEQDETEIMVICLLLGPSKPADRPVNAQTQLLGET
jgi:hypothetical protein